MKDNFNIDYKHPCIVHFWEPFAIEINMGTHYGKLEIIKGN